MKHAGPAFELPLGASGCGEICVAALCKVHLHNTIDVTPQLQLHECHRHTSRLEASEIHHDH